MPGKGQSLRGQVVDWLMRLEEAPHDQALRADFERWLAQSEGHRKAYRAVDSVWRDGEELPSALTPPAVVALRAAPGRPARRRVLLGAAMALAACVAMVAYPVVRLRLSADQMTGVAELREITLDDGSQVSLDAASAIAVDYTPQRRTVRLLAGQAFFQVVPSRDRPFVVDASDVTVTVTGTAFNVGTSSLGVAVAVEHGTVSVSREGRELAALTVGQRLQVQPNGTAVRGAVVPADVAAWRSQRLVVHDAPVREVVEEIGGHLPGMIFFRDGDMADRRVTGVIDLSRPEEALQAVVTLQGGKVLKLSPYVTVISSR